MALKNTQLFARLLPLVGLLLAAAYSGAASAQETASPGNQWTKLCTVEKKSKTKVCLVTQEIRSATGQFLASVAVREINGPEKQTVVISVPPGMLLQPGMRLQVDDHEEQEVKYGICFPKYCYSELAIKPSFIAEMKGGEKLVVTAFSQQGKAIGFELTLAGFTSSYDGDPIDPAQIKAQREKVQQELAEKAKAARDNLIKQQEDATKN
tara:strand:- start:15277 stop:15903 length:627 start_codon:yes stop_codon:yes gene_type:complete